jgi:hypothetical protein
MYKEITKEAMAEVLEGMDVNLGMPQVAIDTARENGLVIVYGYGDDIIEFDGAIYDETNVGERTTVKFDKEGIIPDWDTLEKENEDEVRAYFRRKDSGASEVVALWDVDDIPWSYVTAIPHATFTMLEEGEPFCRGIVFDIESVYGF